MPAETPEGSVRFRRVPVEISCEVPEVSGARKFLVQLPDEVPEADGAVGQPAGVNGASVWVSLGSYDRCRAFPLNRVEAVASFSPIQASLAWLQIFIST